MGLNPLCGDLDDDGDVDPRDLRRIVDILAARGYSPRVDYNLEGRADLRDLAVFVRGELEFKLGRFVGGDWLSERGPVSRW